MDKDNMACTHNGILLSLKKEKEILQYTTMWMNPGDIIQAKSQKDKLFTFRWFQK